jgi:tetratricopeptide (TPR) repeat protein
MDASERYLKEVCPHCQGHVEFPAEGVGQQSACPHCGKIITLERPQMATPSRLVRRVVIGAGAGLILMLVAISLLSPATKSPSLSEGSVSMPDENVRRTPEKGDAQAQFETGEKYENGEGVPKDYGEALKWYRKAAGQNYATAQYRVGLCYDTGRGVAQDYAEAAKWYRKAAEQNLAQAQNNLGFCYDIGLGVAQDEVETVNWYRKAAEQNFARAQRWLGDCYANGSPCAKSNCYPRTGIVVPEGCYPLALVHG